MEEALDFCFRFVSESDKTWIELADLPLHRFRFQKQLFPEKISFDGEKFGTAKLSPILRLNQENGANKSQLVSPLYLEWNTLESMVLKWNEVFQTTKLAQKIPVFA